MEINRAIDDSEPLEPNPPGSELLHDKPEQDVIVYYKSEENLDRLL
jgi:hypothetical protein